MSPAGAPLVAAGVGVEVGRPEGIVGAAVVELNGTV